MLRRLLPLVAVALLAAPAAAHASKPDILFSAADPSAAGVPAGSGRGANTRDSWRLAKDRWYDVLVDYDISEESGTARKVSIRGRGTGVDVRPRKIGDDGRITLLTEANELVVPVRLTADRATLQLVITSSKGRLARQVIDLKATEVAAPRDGTWASPATAPGTLAGDPATFTVRDGRVQGLSVTVKQSCLGVVESQQPLGTATFPDVRIPRVGVIRKPKTLGYEGSRLDLRFPSATEAFGDLVNTFDERCSGYGRFKAFWVGP